jgi:hypothetical protein
MKLPASEAEKAGGFLSTAATWMLMVLLVLFYVAVFWIIVQWLPSEQSL